MTVLVRAAGAGDVEDLARIGAASFAMACPASTPPADLAAYIASELTPERFTAHLACPARSLFVAEVEGAAAGYLMLAREQTPAAVGAGRALEVRRLYVLPPFHGQGVAQALMGQALRLAHRDACKRIWLGVSKHNARAIRFYRKHGFEVVGEQLFPVGADIHEDYLMARTTGVGPKG